MPFSIWLNPTWKAQELRRSGRVSAPHHGGVVNNPSPRPRLHKQNAVQGDDPAGLSCPHAMLVPRRMAPWPKTAEKIALHLPPSLKGTRCAAAKPQCAHRYFPQPIDSPAGRHHHPPTGDNKAPP
jgi:hypothetical protein